VLGDSHADAMFPAFARISRESGRQGLLMHHLTCPSLIHFNGVPAGVEGCRRMQEAALDSVSRDGIRHVFLVARFTNYEPRAAFPARVDKTIATYAERGATLYIVAQVPEQPHFEPRRWARELLWSRFGIGTAAAIVRSQSVSREEHEAQRAYAKSVWDKYAADSRVKIIDVTPVFCDNESCAAGKVTGPFYADDDHVNADGALWASDAIARQAGIVLRNGHSN
jgi:hypothetical protein